MSWEQIPGWFDFQDIYDQAVEEGQDGDVFVEVGVGFGRSIAYLARKVIDSGKNIKIYGVDPFQDDWDTDHPTWGAEHAVWAREQGGPYSAFVTMMRTHSPQELERVNILRCRSREAAKGLMHTPVQFVFIDGDHCYESVKEDIEYWKDNLQWSDHGTPILAGHDYCSTNFPGVVKAVKEAFGEEGKDFEVRKSSWFKKLGREHPERP